MADYRRATEYRKEPPTAEGPSSSGSGGWLADLSAPQKRVFL